MIFKKKTGFLVLCVLLVQLMFSLVAFADYFSGTTNYISIDRRIQYTKDKSVNDYGYSSMYNVAMQRWQFDPVKTIDFSYVTTADDRTDCVLQV